MKNRAQLYYRLSLTAEDWRMPDMTLTMRDAAILRRWLLDLQMALEDNGGSAMDVMMSVDEWVKQMDERGAFDVK